MAETTANTVADFIIKTCRDRGYYLSNLKLQKLLFYAQAWHLAIEEKPLFDEDFQAWIAGPIQPEVYYRFEPYKWYPIKEYPDKVELPPKIEEMLIDAIGEYGLCQAYYLETTIKSEDPWLNARGGIPENEDGAAIISKEDMQTYYKAFVEEVEVEEEEEPQVSYA